MSCGKEAVDIGKLDNPLIVGDGRPMMVAHRGGAGEYPENTLFAFKNARDLAMDYLEMDVRLTLDDHLVVHHDSLVDRTSDGFGEVATMDLSDLKKLNFAANFTNARGKGVDTSSGKDHQISTIEEIFKEFPQTKMHIEIKDKDDRGKLAADLLLKSIKEYHKEGQVVISSFHDSILDYFRKISDGKIPTAAGPIESLWFYFSYITGVDSFYKPKSDLFAFSPKMYGLDLSGKEIIDAAHRRNLAVHYWTINNPEEMKRLIDNGADGIMSDYPSMLMEVILEDKLDVTLKDKQ